MVWCWVVLGGVVVWWHDVYGGRWYGRPSVGYGVGW